MSPLSTALRKLPPEVARELRRHVSPRLLSQPTTSTASTTTTASANGGDVARNTHHHRTILYVCLGLTATAATFPLLSSYWIQNMQHKDAPLTAAQIRRGAFNNSGSRDAGRDPEYGQHATGYGADNNDNDNSGQQQQQQQLPGHYLAVAPSKMKDYEAKIEAFAKGQGRNN